MGGEHLISAGSKARLEMQQADGNLVLKNADGSVLWSSGTSGHPNSYLTFQKSDGNLVLYASKGKSTWSSKPHNGAAQVVLQDDCDLVTQDSSGKTLWSLGTSCKGTQESGLVV